MKNKTITDFEVIKRFHDFVNQNHCIIIDTKKSVIIILNKSCIKYKCVADEKLYLEAYKLYISRRCAYHKIIRKNIVCYISNIVNCSNIDCQLIYDYVNDYVGWIKNKHY